MVKDVCWLSVTLLCFFQVVKVDGKIAFVSLTRITEKKKRKYKKIDEYKGLVVSAVGLYFLYFVMLVKWDFLGLFSKCFSCLYTLIK